MNYLILNRCEIFKTILILRRMRFKISEFDKTWDVCYD